MTQCPFSALYDGVNDRAYSEKKWGFTGVSCHGLNGLLGRPCVISSSFYLDDLRLLFLPLISLPDGKRGYAECSPHTEFLQMSKYLLTCKFPRLVDVISNVGFQQSESDI